MTFLGLNFVTISLIKLKAVRFVRATLNQGLDNGKMELNLGKIMIKPDFCTFLSHHLSLFETVDDLSDFTTHVAS